MEDLTFKMQIIRNPDAEYVKGLKKRIKANNGYCPTQMEKIPENKCPCKYHEETGDCYCGLWISVPVWSET